MKNIPKIIRVSYPEDGETKSDQGSLLTFLRPLKKDEEISAIVEHVREAGSVTIEVQAGTENKVHFNLQEELAPFVHEIGSKVEIFSTRNERNGVIVVRKSTER